ncbi:hypothetical protein [Parabacteroides chinchillae]|uniref:LTXXQ motif family protein n=1 Tax=Parabacteroides chinchillae TaxID=871327 RepID=A0A8G2F1G4_9BACT|nr:hypothetical protein [Parabacteroides chinchillae]SEF89271.1 hypothetical protein SAMN05444001_10910 [Parabacteroides chinchillae]
MKKVIGLCLVIVLSSVSVFARDGKRMDKRNDDSSKRYETMVESLKLDEKQAAEFRKINQEFADKMKVEREKAKVVRDKKRAEMTAMRTERDAQLKKVLTEEQYKLYQEKMAAKKIHRKGNGRR